MTRDPEYWTITDLRDDLNDLLHRMGLWFRRVPYNIYIFTSSKAVWPRSGKGLMNLSTRNKVVFPIWFFRFTMKSSRSSVPASFLCSVLLYLLFLLPLEVSGQEAQDESQLYGTISDPCTNRIRNAIETKPYLSGYIPIQGLSTSEQKRKIGELVSGYLRKLDEDCPDKAMTTETVYELNESWQAEKDSLNGLWLQEFLVIEDGYATLFRKHVNTLQRMGFLEEDSASAYLKKRKFSEKAWVLKDKRQDLLDRQEIVLDDIKYQLASVRISVVAIGLAIYSVNDKPEDIVRHMVPIMLRKVSHYVMENILPIALKSVANRYVGARLVEPSKVYAEASDAYDFFSHKQNRRYAFLFQRIEIYPFLRADELTSKPNSSLQQLEIMVGDVDSDSLVSVLTEDRQFSPDNVYETYGFDDRARQYITVQQIIADKSNETLTTKLARFDLELDRIHAQHVDNLQMIDSVDLPLVELEIAQANSETDSIRRELASLRKMERDQRAAWVKMREKYEDHGKYQIQYISRFEQKEITGKRTELEQAEELAQKTLDVIRKIKAEAITSTVLMEIDYEAQEYPRLRRLEKRSIDLNPEMEAFRILSFAVSPDNLFLFNIAFRVGWRPIKIFEIVRSNSMNVLADLRNGGRQWRLPASNPFIVGKINSIDFGDTWFVPTEEELRNLLRSVEEYRDFEAKDIIEELHYQFSDGYPFATATKYQDRMNEWRRVCLQPDPLRRKDLFDEDPAYIILVKKKSE